MNAKLIRSLGLWVFMLFLLAAAGLSWIWGEHGLSYIAFGAAGVTGIVELASVLKYDETVTQHFVRNLLVKHFWRAVLICLCLLCSIAGLVVHLIVK